MKKRKKKRKETKENQETNLKLPKKAGK